MGLFGSGGILPSVGGFIGDIATGGALSNSKDQAAANQANIGQAQSQMAFQERMSNSAWQRGVEDMRKAGLNPALAYTQGPASAPSGSAATIASERHGDIGGNIGETAKAAYGIHQQAKSIESQVALNQASADVAHVNADKLTANAQEAKENIQNIKEDTKRKKEAAKREKMARQIDEANMPAKKAQAVANERTSKADALMAYPDAALERLKSFIPFTRSNAKNYNNTYNNTYNSSLP